jgi:hypothetical protein
MPKLFLTYAWRDNEDSKIDYLASVLKRQNVDALIDKWTIPGGMKLWDKIDRAIADPDLDGWAIFATRASLQSEACREELAYALDRALSVRGDQFPLIGIFLEALERQEIPSPIRVRRYVLLSDPTWPQIVAQSLAGKASESDLSSLGPVITKWHPPGPTQQILELRPRIDFWHPAVVLLPEAEADAIDMHAAAGPPGHPPAASITMAANIELADPLGRKWKGQRIDQQISPNQSLYLWLKARPSKLIFGAVNGPQYVMPPD